MVEQALHTGTADGRVGTDDVPIRTKLWCTLLMVIFASFSNLMQVAFTALTTTPDTLYYIWCVLCTLLALPSGLLLTLRTNRPVLTFWAACVCCSVLPFDSLMVMMALTAMIARRDSKNLTLGGIAATAAVSVWCQLRDVMRPPDVSLWQAIFTKNGTGATYGTEPELIIGQPAIAGIAIACAAIGVALSVLIGLQIRQRAITSAATAKADAAQNTVVLLKHDLDSQQFADALAAEAHDTLAHSLSLLALNASALQATTNHLQANLDPANTPDVVRQDVSSIAATAQDIRKQAAGALDEAHTIIDTLRHPEQAAALFTPTYETSLTRASLNALVDDARAAGMRIDSWIDIRDLSSLSDKTSKIAYRAVQEALTNARRHAMGATVALQVDAAPDRGIHIHVSNQPGNHHRNQQSAPRSAAMPAAPAATTTATATAVDSAPATSGAPTAAHTPATCATPAHGSTPASNRNSSTTAPNHDSGNANHNSNANRTGEGLAGLAARVRQLHGTCAYGFDDHRIFHVDVTLPWAPQAALAQPRLR